MSQRQAKKKRKNQEPTKTNFIEINRSEYVGKDQVIEYLFNKLKSFSGYFFISIGAVGSLYKAEDRKNLVAIVAHHSVPVMDENGAYRSDKDKMIEVIKVDDPEFGGLVIDRHGNGMLGNPFAPVSKSDIPNLGEESAKLPGEEIFGTEETVESL